MRPARRASAALPGILISMMSPDRPRACRSSPTRCSTAWRDPACHMVSGRSGNRTSFPAGCGRPVSSERYGHVWGSAETCNDRGQERCFRWMARPPYRWGSGDRCRHEWDRVPGPVHAALAALAQGSPVVAQQRYGGIRSCRYGDRPVRCGRLLSRLSARARPFRRDDRGCRSFPAPWQQDIFRPAGQRQDGRGRDCGATRALFHRPAERYDHSFHDI